MLNHALQSNKEYFNISLIFLHGLMLSLFKSFTFLIKGIAYNLDKPTNSVLKAAVT